MKIKLTKEILKDLETFKEKRKLFLEAKEEMLSRDTQNSRMNYDFHEGRMKYWKNKISEKLFKLLLETLDDTSTIP